MKTNPVIHFELPAEDKKRVTEFYTNAFGWKTNQIGPEMSDYILVSTIESDKNGQPIRPGGINGGIFQKTEDVITHSPSVVIAVDDIKEHIEKVQKAGGKVIGKPTDIPGVGIFISFYDTEGNRLSMLQPIMPQ